MLRAHGTLQTEGRKQYGFHRTASHAAQGRPCFVASEKLRWETRGSGGRKPETWYAQRLMGAQP